MWAGAITAPFCMKVLFMRKLRCGRYTFTHVLITFEQMMKKKTNKQIHTLNNRLSWLNVSMAKLKVINCPTSNPYVYIELILCVVISTKLTSLCVDCCSVNEICQWMRNPFEGSFSFFLSFFPFCCWCATFIGNFVCHKCGPTKKKKHKIDAYAYLAGISCVLCLNRL